MWHDGARCFFVGRGAGPCSGVLIRAHLIPKQRIRREVITARSTGARWPANTAQRGELDRILWDPRCWVPMCGGPMGNAGHHGMLDGRQLEIARADLPGELEEFAQEHGLEWSLERDYGPKET